MVSANLIKELREKTGAGMLDCKKALAETNNDLDAAIDWLREKGIAKAAKKASRIAAEGLCNYILSGNKAYIYEVNAETDFVAKNEKFINLIDQIGQIIVKNDNKCAECALASGAEQLVVEATATIGEKISLRRVICLEKNDGQIFGAYKHMGGKIVTACVLNGDDAEVAKDLAMHVTASRPVYLTRTNVPAEYVEKEKHIQIELAHNDEKLKDKTGVALEKIIEGKVNKILKDICLLDQAFVKDQNVTVEQYLAGKKASVVEFVRLEVGEGIEKREDDFAAEVEKVAAAARK